MKIKGEDFDKLKAGLLAALERRNIQLEQIDTERSAWDLFSRAWQDCSIDGHDLYRKYNDVHIATAMRVIFPAWDR